MAYNTALAERVRNLLKKSGLPLEEKRMMGGLTFMVNGKMCLGVLNDDLMARISPEDYPMALSKPGCRKMDLTGRPMNGFVFIDKIGTRSQQHLRYWVSLALSFNPRAKSSKKSDKNKS